MATSAFKSTTKRMSVGGSPSSAGGSSSSNRRPEAHRRSRSLSRFSRRLPGDYTEEEEEEEGETPAPPTRGRFVNTMRGTGFAEATLDDLSITFFGSAGGDQGRSGSRGDGGGASASQRRGRSVSRQGANGKGTGVNKNARADSETSNSRRRRSVSVVPYRTSDSESDLDHHHHHHTLNNHAKLRDSSLGNRRVLASDKTAYSNPRPGLQRSLSQKDLRQHDGYSSHSSVLTDDEGRDAYCDKNGPERTIRAVYAQKVEHPTGNDMNGGLYEVMRKELRHAVDDIRMELEQSTMNKRSTSGSASDVFLESRGSDVMRVVKSYASKLEESEKRKHDLLAEMVLEEQRGQEITRIVKELLPDTHNASKDKPLRTRKRSNDRSRMSKRLTEEAEKYIEDFLSNIEDTDISSLDGERSETSSTLGGTLKNETFQSPPLTKSLPVEMDGVVLPWLQWETANDTSPLPYSIKTEPTLVPKANNAWHTLQESSPIELSNHAASSRGSWSPVVADDQSASPGEVTGGRRYGETRSSHRQLGSLGTKPSFDVEEYLSRPSEEEFLLERWRQDARVSSGSLLLCNQMPFIR